VPPVRGREPRRLRGLPAGSFRLGTVIRPVHNRDEYDLDLVCRRDLAKESITQAALKEDVGAGLAGYEEAAAARVSVPTLEEGDRCWTLVYPSDRFHMDILVEALEEVQPRALAGWNNHPEIAVPEMASTEPGGKLLVVCWELQTQLAFHLDPIDHDPVLVGQVDELGKRLQDISGHAVGSSPTFD
jgi:hypothetical protein